MIGERLDPVPACLAVLAAVAASLAIVFLLKAIHDVVRPGSEVLVQRYIEVAGRITALYVGTIALDMILEGIRESLERF